MGVAGQRAKPTHLKLVQGNPGKRKIARKEPRPKGDLDAPPPWLTDSQKKGWAYVLEHAPKGLLKRLDRAVLVSWIVAEDLHRQAVELLNGSQLLVRTPGGMPIQSPYLQIVNKQAELMIRAAGEMGFSPAARTRIEMPEGEAGGTNEFFD